MSNYLATNPKITNANIRFNPIGDEGGSALMSVLSTNNKIQQFDLARCSIGDETMLAFKEALQKRKSGGKNASQPLALISLSLENNSISSLGLSYLAEALLDNQDICLISEINLRSNSNITYGGGIPTSSSSSSSSSAAAVPSSTAPTNTASRATFTPDGLVLLSRYHCTENCTLTALDLSRCILGDAGVAALAQALGAATSLRVISLEKFVHCSLYILSGNYI